MITADNYNTFCVAFWNSDDKDVLRFGQAFCNKFRITDSDLFYETSLIKTKIKIFEKYVTTHS